MLFFIVSLVFSCLMVPGTIVYAILSVTDRTKEARCVALTSGTALAAALLRTFAAGQGLFTRDLAAAVTANRLYEAVLLLFLPIIPVLVGAFLGPDRVRLRRINRTLTAVGGAAALVFAVFLFGYPGLYLGVSADAAAAPPVEFGRGPAGPAYYASNVLLAGYCLYAFAAAVWDAVRHAQRPYLRTLGLGLGVAILIILSEFYEVFTGRFPTRLLPVDFPRLLAALTVFSITAVVAMTQKAVRQAKEIEEERLGMIRKQTELAQAAYRDEMTGLPNRQALFRDIGGLFSPGRTLLVADIDNMAFVNAYHGYAVGDALIRAVAEACVAAKPADAALYRSNADTFVTIMRGNAADAEAVAGRLIAAIGALAVPGADDKRFSASVGIAEAYADIPDAHTWLNRSNTALVAAKLLKNRSVTFDPRMHRDETRRHAIIEGLRESLEGQGFHLVYQPIVAPDERLVGAEALVRWSHPDLGPISPYEFVPLAEGAGFVSRITDFVVRRVAEDFGPDRTECPPIRISVNLSRRDLGNPALVADLRASMGEGNPCTDIFGFEVTETDIISDWRTSLANLLSIRDMGYSISLDDFGTGYSSLGYLKQLPLDKLKIDRKFLIDIPGDRKDQILLDTIVKLGHDLDLALVAEGIENPGQFAYLKARDCDYYQGYLFSPPMTIEAFRAWASGNLHREGS